MISDRDYNALADSVYSADKNKAPEPIRKGQEIKVYDSNNEVSSKYEVLKVEDNTDNGMQAMAVAPITKNGKVDTTQIVIAYAGTNFSDAKDRATDIQTIAGGNKELSLNPYHQTEGQAITAQTFADVIKMDYPNATISTTGHSLGEYLALMIAAENQWRNVGFNGPDPYGILSADAKDWIKKNPGLLTNYRNRGDNVIGNLMGNGTGAEIKVGLEMGIRGNILDYHELSAWEFDKNGRLKIPDNDYNKNAIRQQAERYLMMEFVASMYALSLLEKRFRASGGGLSANEELYLDASQANAIVTTASQSLKLAMTAVIKVYQDAIDDVEKLWSECQSKARNVAPDLNESEIDSALSAVGATRESIVSEPSEKYREKISEAKKTGETFDTLSTEIQSKIAEVVQKDQELAAQLAS